MSRPYRPYRPKTGRACPCKPGVHRDNCPDCEGTGQQIDFAAIRARTLTTCGWCQATIARVLPTCPKCGQNPRDVVVS